LGQINGLLYQEVRERGGGACLRLLRHEDDWEGLPRVSPSPVSCQEMLRGAD